MRVQLFFIAMTITAVITVDSNETTSNCGSSQYLQVLKGRDGRDGRDGQPGPRGPRGETGVRGEKGERGTQGLSGGGAVYIRWGRTVCPAEKGTKLLYSGRTAGSHYSQTGGGANYICLPNDPEYLVTNTVTDKWRGYLYGTEYELPVGGNLHNHNVPCAVCHVPTRASQIMIPAKISCPTNWTVEYQGYLMSDYNAHKRTMFVCVDKDGEAIPGHAAFAGGAFLYNVETKCIGIPCPPYNDNKELACVVCTN